MKYILSLIFIVLMTVGCSTSLNQSSSEKISSASVLAITKKLDKKLETIGKLASSNRIELKAIEINLKTVATNRAEGGFGILVFNAGASSSKIDTTSIKIEMTKLKKLGGQTSLSEQDKLDSFVVALNDIILNAGNYKVAGLGTEKITADLSFVVEETVTAGVKDFELKPITLSLSGESKRNNTHSIKLIFQRVSKPSDVS